MASLPYPRRHQIIFPQKPTQPNHLWASVKSVGEYHTPETSVSICEIRGRISCARNFCEFREFRGRTSEGGVGMAGCHTLLRKLPQIARMCRFTQNLLLRRVSHRFHRFTQRLLVRRFCVLCVFCGSFYILT